jgi:hypothetical protein
MSMRRQACRRVGRDGHSVAVARNFVDNPSNDARPISLEELDPAFRNRLLDAFRDWR